MKVGNYPPSGGNGALYSATDSPVRTWCNVAGVWRPWIEGTYLGGAPGSCGDFPTRINGWDGHGFTDAPLPGVPRWTITTGQSLAVHAACRALSPNVGAFAECVLLHEHNTIAGTNTGQDYACGLAVADPVTKAARSLMLTFLGGSPTRVGLWGAANYTANNWSQSMDVYTETGEGVRRTGPQVLRVERTAARTLTFSVSRNGVVYEPIATYTEASDGACTLVGPTLVASYNGANPVGVSVLSWLQG